MKSSDELGLDPTRLLRFINPMILSVSQKKRSAKKWAFAIFVWLFLVVWLTGMFASITAQACRNEFNEGAKKLRFCNSSILARSLLPGGANKGSIIYLERGIAHAQLGARDNAREDMVRALIDASDGLSSNDAMFRDTWIRTLVKRMKKEYPTSPAYLVWQDVLSGHSDF